MNVFLGLQVSAAPDWARWKNPQYCSFGDMGGSPSELEMELSEGTMMSAMEL